MGVFHWGGALAYYALFSLTPLLLLGVTGAGWLLGREATRTRAVEQAAEWLGPNAEQVVREVLEQVSLLTFDSVLIIPTVLILLLGATAVFANVQAALNDIWGLEARSGAVKNLIRTRLMSLLMILVLGGAVILSVFLSTVSQVLLPYLPETLADTLRLGQLVDVGVSLAVLWFLLTMTFTILPDARLAWKDVWVGAGFTAVLLYLGKALLGIYFGHASLGSAFGAAGSVFSLLVWIYYSAQIFFLGAVFTRVWADQHGARVRPEPYAVRVVRRKVERKDEEEEEDAVQNRSDGERA